MKDEVMHIVNEEWNIIHVHATQRSKANWLHRASKTCY
jgi:hypothetical protein